MDTFFHSFFSQNASLREQESKQKAQFSSISECGLTSRVVAAKLRGYDLDNKRKYPFHYLGEMLLSGFAVMRPELKTNSEFWRAFSGTKSAPNRFISLQPSYIRLVDVSTYCYCFRRLGETTMSQEPKYAHSHH